MSPDDWAVFADRLEVAGDRRAETLAMGLRLDPRALTALTAAADLAPLLPPGDWPWTLLCPPLTRSMTFELYAHLRPKIERESRRVLPTGGSLSQITRTLRKKPRRPPRMRRLQRPDRYDRITTLARLLDPLMPERWRWSALAQLIAGDPDIIRQVGQCLRGWADVESILKSIQSVATND